MCKCTHGMYGDHRSLRRNNTVRGDSNVSFVFFFVQFNFFLWRISYELLLTTRNVIEESIYVQSFNILLSCWVSVAVVILMIYSYNLVFSLESNRRHGIKRANKHNHIPFRLTYTQFCLSLLFRCLSWLLRSPM